MSSHKQEESIEIPELLDNKPKEEKTLVRKLTKLFEQRLGPQVPIVESLKPKKANQIIRSVSNTPRKVEPRKSPHQSNSNEIKISNSRNVKF